MEKIRGKTVKYVVLLLFQINLLSAQSDTLFFNVLNRTLETDSEIRLDFTVENFDSISGFQYALRFDTNILELIAIEIPDTASIPMSNLNDSVFVDLTDTLLIESCIQGNFGLCKSGEIRIVWIDPWSVTVSDSTLIFSLYFKVYDKGKLSDHLYLDPTILHNSAGDFRQNTIPLDVRFIHVVNLLVNDNDVNLYDIEVYPNPFTNSTLINFEGVHNFIVYNQLGELIQLGIFNNKLEFFGNEPGIYYIKVDNRIVKVIKI